MKLETLVVGDKEFKIDPETNFWGVGETQKLEQLFHKVRKDILAEMRDFRFTSDIILLYVNPTDGCNARCPYCYLPQQLQSRNRSLSYTELEVIVRKASQYFGAKGMKGSVVFHGAEPFLNKENIFKIIEAYRKDLHFGIQTNGTLLSREDAEFIKKNGVNIGISLDSPDEKTNDDLRGQGHYQKVLQALDWFVGYPGLNVVTTITSKNVHQLSAMVRFLHGRGVSLCLMNPVRGTQKNALALRPDPAILTSEFLMAVEESIRLTKEGKRIVIGDFANVILGIVAPSARVMMCDVSPCGGGRRFFATAANGDAYPCGEFIGMEEFLGGNILDGTIEDIANSKNFLRLRERVVENISECKECLIRNICGAPCPAEIYSTDGTMYAKSYYCDFYKKVAQRAFEVIYREDVKHVLRTSAFKEQYDLSQSHE